MKKNPLLLVALATLVSSFGFAETFVVVPGRRAGRLPPQAALGAAAVGSRSCNNARCVVRPTSDAHRNELRGLEIAGIIESWGVPNAGKLQLAVGTYDADSGRFEGSIPGVDELPRTPDSVFGILFDTYPEAHSVTLLSSLGFTPLEVIPPMGYLFYGQRDQVLAARRVPHVRAVVEIPAGLKREGIDPLPSGDAGGVARTTVVVADAPGALTKALLLSLGAKHPTFTQGRMVAYSVLLDPVEARAMSRRPDVIMVMRHSVTPTPSDERSNVIVRGLNQPGPHVPAWPSALVANNPPYWDSFLQSLGRSGSSTFNLSNQAIGFLDTGLSTSDVATVFTTDITVEFNTTRARDSQAHGTLVASIAAGMVNGEREANGNYAFRQGVATGARVGMSKVFTRVNPGCDTLQYRDVGTTTLSPPNFWPDIVKYSLVELGSAGPPIQSEPLPDTLTYGPGARIINHSWNFDGRYTYDDTTVLFDQSARKASVVSFDFGAQGAPNVRRPDVAAFLHVVSAGNYNTGDRSIEAPGRGKNILTVGATYSSNTQGFDHSRCGNIGSPAYDPMQPTADPRLVAPFSRIGAGVGGTFKPDLVAPGARSYGRRSEAMLSQCTTLCSLTQPTGSTAWEYGTSFAAPVVSGAAAIVAEWHRDLLATLPFDQYCLAPYSASPVVSPAFLRAALIAGGTPLAGTAPNNVEGFGGVSLDRALSYPVENLWYDGFHFDQLFTMNPNTSPWQALIHGAQRDAEPLVVALAWTDRPGAVNAPGLINDLKLTVEQLNDQGVVLHRWHGNRYSGIYSLRDPGKDINDATGTIERVTVDPSQVGPADHLRITVTPVSITADGLDPETQPPYPPENLRQDFAVVAYNTNGMYCLAEPLMLPVIYGVGPGCGPEGGGTELTISGNGFEQGATVTVGGAQASVTNITTGSITALAPAHARGYADVAVTNPGGNSAAFPAGHTYRGFMPVEYWSGPYWGSAKTMFVDVTGDGKADLVADNGTEVKVRRSNGYVFGGPETWSSGIGNPRAKYCADVDGDGDADLILVDIYAATVSVRRSAGASFGNEELWSTVFPLGTHGTYFADATGDGKADAISVTNSGVVVRPSNGSAFPSYQYENWTGTAYFGTSGTFFADVTGDGKADALALNGALLVVRRSTGTSFGSNEYWTSAFPDAAHGRTFADVNGDSRADAVSFGSTAVWVALSTGAGLYPAEGWTEVAFYGGVSLGSYTADVSGDGRSDAIAHTTSWVAVRNGDEGPCQ